jgi:hypothetical protein
MSRYQPRRTRAFRDWPWHRQLLRRFDSYRLRRRRSHAAPIKSYQFDRCYIRVRRVRGSVGCCGTAPVWQSISSNVSWAAIAAGAVVAAALTLAPVALGVGLGLSAVSPWSGSGVGETTFKLGSGVWLVAAAMICARSVSSPWPTPHRDAKQPSGIGYQIEANRHVPATGVELQSYCAARKAGCVGSL